MSSLNLTWQAQEFDGKDLKIKIDFSDPNAISPLIEQDKLVAHFKSTELFII